MAVFSVSELDTWLRTYEGVDRDGNPLTTYRPEFPIRVYLRWLRTTDDPDTFNVKIDLAVTQFGEQIMNMNAPDARRWIEQNFSTYPESLSNSLVRDLQQICEFVETGRSGPLTIDIQGGTFSIDNEEQIIVNGQLRAMIHATITTPDVLHVTIEDSIRATIDTTSIR